MNLVGKTFIVLILILSVMFMTLMFTVYATHKNWKQETEDVKAKLAAKEKQYNELNAQLTEQKKVYAYEVKAKNEALAKLASTRERLESDRDAAIAKYETVHRQRNEVINAIDNVHTTMAETRREINQWREAFRTLQADNAKNLRELVKVTEESQQASLELATLVAVGKDLAKDYRDACEVLAHLDAVPKPSLYSGPPALEGKILDVQVNNANNNSIVEISLGSDDGLLKGHQLYVYRNSNGDDVLLGKIEVVATEPNRAACRVLPEYRKGNILREDNVKTKFN